MYVVFYYVTLTQRECQTNVSNKSSLKELPGASKLLKTCGPKQAQITVPPPREPSTSEQHPRQKVGNNWVLHFL